MIKRLIAVLLVLVSLVGILPFSVFASDETAEVILLEDGSYLEVITKTASARVANTVSGTKELVYHASNGDVEWTASLNATFAYSGGWYTCTTANCTVTIENNQWYVISNSTVRSSNNAVTSLTMGLKHLGVTVQRPQYTIKLTCDSNGNLS